MRSVILIFMTVIFIALTGCSNKAAELYDIAQFEEKQKNNKHAAELYEDIMKKYPDSEYAKKARERLVILKDESESAAK